MDYWTCPICEIKMQMQSRAPHLSGKRHAAAARAYSQIIPQESRSQEGPKQRTCKICNIEVQTQSRESHLSEYRHAVASHEEESHKAYFSNHNNNNNNHTITTSSSIQATMLPAISGVAGITWDTVFAASDVTEVDGAPGVLVWQCTLCNCCVPLSVKQSHLSSVDHIQKLLEMIKLTCMTIPEPQVEVPKNNGGTMNRLGYEDVAYETKRLVGRIKNQKSYDEATAESSTMNSLLEPTAQANMKSNLESPVTSISPLDVFFSCFRGYQYDPSIPPAESFRSLRRGLRRWNDWDGNVPDTWKEYEKDVITRYQAALTKEFNLWFGTEDDIDSWHSLCRAIGIGPLPTTCHECREAVWNMHINIVDLIQWARKRGVGQVEVFKTVKELSDYCYNEDKIYNKDQLGQGAVLRHLLRKLAKERRVGSLAYS